jgi:hypothetical protein
MQWLDRESVARAQEEIPFELHGIVSLGSKMSGLDTGVTLTESVEFDNPRGRYWQRNYHCGHDDISLCLPQFTPRSQTVASKTNSRGHLVLILAHVQERRVLNDCTFAIIVTVPASSN